MKNFKKSLNTIIGSIAIYLSIAFLAVGLNLQFLVVIGLVIAPILVICFNKKFTIKPMRYYSTLLGILLVTLIFSAIIMPKDSNASSQQQIAIENQDLLAESKEDTNIEYTGVKEDIPNEDSSEDNITKETSNNSTEDIFAGYKLIEVDGGNLSGHREPNVVVDIGFGDREYYAFTNEYGQLVKVIAKIVKLQDDSTEPVNSNGRYYSDEAKVPGVESKTLDEGHVIADSLGGVSNAYNITPQNSTLNRHGDQAYMEKNIRDAGGCTDFVAIITYPDTNTQIPNHYSYTYTINGNVINDEFDNVNPDEYNANIGINNSSSKASSSNNSNTSSSKNANTSEIVYWTPNGKSYHSKKSCSTLSRSKNILEGTIEQSGKSDPCDRCY